MSLIEGSRASSLVTPALTVAPLEPRWGKSVCSLISQEADPRPLLREIYKACSLYIICVNNRSSCVDRTYLSTYHIILYNYIHFHLRRKTLRSLRSEL